MGSQEEITEDTLINKALQDAMIKNLRLQDDQLLKDIGVFSQIKQKSYRYTAIKNYYVNHLKGTENASKKLQEKIASSFFVVLDVKIPTVQLNF